MEDEERRNSFGGSMPVSLSDDQMRCLRLRAQRLTTQQHGVETSVTQVVREMCGIQAQEAPAASLAARVRSIGLTAADVEQARVQERSVVRTWGLRGTLHLLATEDLSLLLPLLGPVFVAGSQRRRAELGLDEDTCARGIGIMSKVLANHGPLTRAEIVEQLATHGMHIEGQARPHLLSRAALEGVICFGPDRGAEPTYVLLSDWIDQAHRRGYALSESAALAELTRRYLSAYGPATPVDQATWSGMPLSKTRAAWQHIANELMEVDARGAPAWMLKTRAGWLDELAVGGPIVRLLPHFDIYLLGYQNRELSVPPQHAKRINAGGGLLNATVLVDGRAVGTWTVKRKKSQLEIYVEPFDQITPEMVPGLEAEVGDIGRFLGVEVAVLVM